MRKQSPLFTAQFLALATMLFGGVLAQAATTTTVFKVLIDSDNSTATGCTVATPATISGIDQVLLTTVQSTGSTSSVTKVELQQCSGGSLSAPVTIDATGWPVGTRADGRFVVETHIPYSAFGTSLPSAMHLWFQATTGASTSSVLQQVNGDSIVFTFPGGHRERAVRPGGVRTITLDGNDTDWAGVPPLVPGVESASHGALKFDDIFAFPGSHDLFFYFQYSIDANAPVAVDDLYSVRQGGSITIAGPGVLGNDSNPGGGTLTAAVAIPPALGVLVLAPSGAFSYTQNGTLAPSDSFQYTASNATSTSNTAKVTLAITPNTAPVAVPDAYSVARGLTITVPPPGVLVNDTDAEGDALVSSLVTLPAHGSVSLQPNGSFSYTHDDSNTTSDSFKYVANDGILDSNATTVTLTILPRNHAPGFTAGPNETAVDTAGAQTFVNWATAISAGPPDEAGQALNFIVSNNNNALFTAQPAISPGGTLTFTPAVGQSGVATVTVQLHDNGGTANGGIDTSAPRTFTITIDKIPAITSGNATNFAAGVPKTFAITTTGFPAPAISETGALPSGITLTDNGNGTATLGGTAAQGSGGVYAITLHATNVAGTTPQTFTITVCNTIAVTNPSTTTGVAGAAFSQSFTQTGAVGGATFTTASTLPSGLTLSTAGVLSGTPTVTGTFPITVTVTDANGCAGTGAAYNLTITCQTITVTNPATTTGVAAAAFSQTFTQSGAISGATFSTASTLPAGLTLSAAGLLSGTPTQTGSFPIVVKATDGNGCTGNGATYTLTITCQTITVTNPGATSGTAGSPFSATFTQTGAIGATTFTVASGALPTGLALAANGTLSGTPTVVGSFPITVTATDANGCSGTGSTYNLVIGCQTITVNYPAAGSGTVNAPFSVTFTQSGAIGTTTFTVAGGLLPAGVALSSAGVLSGTPTQSGSFSIQVQVTDANGCIGLGGDYPITIACQTINVTNPGTTSGTVNAGFTAQFTQTGAVGVATFTLNSGTLPTGLALAIDGTLSGTPTQSGSFPITVLVTDGNGCTGVSATYNLFINCQTITVNNPVTTFGQTNTAFSQNFTAGNAIGATTFTTASTLPATFTLATNGTLSGTTTQSGSFPIVVTVTDANGCTGTGATYNLVINDPPAITSGNSATFKVGVAGSFAVTTTGIPTGASMAISESGTLPGGLTFVNNNDGTATLAGTPNAGTGGTYPITITANNGIAPPATQNFTLTVQQPPAITSANNVTFKTGQAGTFTVTTTGFPTGASMVISESGGLPASVTLVDNHDGTATLAGTPNAATGGIYPITITANNGVTPNASQNFTLTVQQAPAITSANNVTFTVGQAGTFTVTTTGFPSGASMIISESGGLPAPVSFVDNHDGTATLSGTPNAGTSGTYSLTIGADNGVTPAASQSFTLTVNEAPAITSGNAAGFEVSDLGTFTVTTTGLPTNASMAISESGALPGGVTFVNNNDGTATLAGTPNSLTGGVYAFTITANNGVAPNATQNFTLTVNEAPQITSANQATFPPGVPTTFTVTTAGFPTGASMLLSETGDPLPGTVTFTDNHDGTATIAGTATGAGDVNIVITASNGIAPDATQNFTIHRQQAPAITSANNTTFKVGVAGTFTVTTTGFPTGASMVISETGGLPASVTFVDNHDGTATIAGTPNAATGGTYPITITANNGVPPNATQNFTLTVQQAPVITSANNATFKVGTAGTFTVTTTGFPTGASMVISETGGLPAPVTLVDNHDGTATLAGTPNAGTGGTYTLTIGADNGVTPAASQSFTLTVQQAPAITSANNATFTVGVAGTFTVTTTGFPTAVALSKTAGSLPLNVTFTDNGNGTATIAGTPNAGTGGTYPITITGNNGVTPNATQSFTLTVQQPPAITSANNATFKVGVAGTFTVTTTGFPTGASMVITETGGLPAPVSFTDNHDGTATLAGTPNAGTGGTYSLTIGADNGVTPAASQSFTLTVQQAPAITSGNTATFQTGQLGSFTVTTTGFPTGASMVISKSGSLPASVTFTDNHDGTATLTGTPSATDGGSYPITITANNGVTPNATQSFTLTINQPPAITSANTTTFAPGVAGTPFTVTTTGFPTNGITRTGTLPSGVTFTDNGNNTATIAGTPASGTQAGSPYAWVITANNGVSPNATQSFTFNVICPTITVARTGGGSFPAATFGVAYGSGQSVTASGSAATPYTYAVTAGALPTGLTLSSAGVISNAAPTATGTFTFTVTATDAGGCTGSQAFSIAVNPVLGTDNYGTVNALVDNTQAYVTGGATATPGTPAVQLSGSVLANDLPAGGVSVTAGTFGTTQGGSVIIQTDGTFLYTPSVHAAAITSDSFTYTGTSNTGGTATATSATGTVNLTLANRVWYVKNNGAGTNGQSQSPFTTLAAAAAASTANDIIFVYNGNGTNGGQNAGIALKSGQQLLGEINGLTVNAQTLVAVGTRPTIGNSAGDGVSVPATAGSLTGVFIKGLAVAGTANGINISATGANTLTATVDNVVITGATANNGIRISGASSTTSTVTVQNSTVSAATQNGIDAQQTVAGNLVLNINNNTITATGTGINVVGTGSTSTTITNFANNAVSGNTGGSGVTVTSATFDAAPGGTFQTVSGGTTVIGSSGNGVGASGMVLTNVAGDLSFTDLDIVTASGTGLFASGTTPYTGSAGFQIAVGAGVATIDATNGPAADLNTVTANLPWSTIKSANSASTGVNLVTVPGTFTAGAGSSITNSTGTDFNINGSNATVTYGGTISDNTGGRLVSIAGTTGGTKSFSGTISDTGVTSTGISLTSNTGATINFSGALTLTTGANDAFTATGGGTVSASDTTSTIVTTTGTAINVANTTIGASNLKFKSVSAGTGASGPANGIILNNTGASGGLIVSGTGSAGSGGTIQKTTTAGVSLTSVGGSVSLTDMNVTTGTHDGIRGTGVANFSLATCSVTNNGTLSADNGVHITDASGTVSMTNTSVTGSFGDNVDFDSTVSSASVVSTFTVTNGAYSSSANGAGFLIQLKNNAAINTGSFTGVTLNANASYAIDLVTNDNSTIGNGVGAPGTGTFTISGNTITNDGGVGVSFAQGGGSGASNMYVRFVSNTMTFTHSHAINVVSGAASNGGTQRVLIDSNIIGTNGVPDSGSKLGEGIQVTQQGRTVGTVTITNNTIRGLSNGVGEFGNRCIDVQTLGPAPTNGAGPIPFDVKVTGNNVDAQYTGTFPLYAIYLGADEQTGTSTTMHAEVHGNTVPTPAAGPCDTQCGPTIGNIFFEKVGTPGSTSTGTLFNFGGNANPSAEIAATNTGTAGKTCTDANITLTATPVNTVP